MTRLERIKYGIKVGVAHGLYILGLLQLWQWITLRRKAVVLMYHRVLSSDQQRRTGSHPGIVVNENTFANQMAVLKERFVVLSLGEFTMRMEQKIPFSNSSCLITFDDGWRDNYTNALPILRQQGLPATIFLPVNYIGRRRLFWREALTHLLVRVVAEVKGAPAERARFLQWLAPVGLGHILDLPARDLRESIISAINVLKPVDAAGIEDLPARLAAELGIRIDDLVTPDDFMDWHQVEAMSKQGIAFGGHGAEHRLLTHVSGDEAQSEIQTSRQVIDSNVTGVPPTFSYPNGSWSPEIAGKVRDSGYRLAFTTQPGRVSCDDEPFTIRRLNIHEGMTSTTPMFLARLVGLF